MYPYVNTNYGTNKYKINNSKITYKYYDCNSDDVRNNSNDSAKENLDVQNGSNMQNVSHDSNICTRSGRNVKKPAYLRDYDFS